MITSTRLHVPTGRLFDTGLFVLGLCLFAWAGAQVVHDGWTLPPLALLSVPLIVVIARFPVVTDQGDGGIEVGFDSAVLMFLVCTLPPSAALAVWGLGVMSTQLLAQRRVEAKVFNVGVGITAGALATAIFALGAGSGGTGPRELAAVLLAAAAYFTTDFIASGVSLALEAGSPVRGTLITPGTWLAIGCFVPLDLLGYLGAVVARSSPWWVLLLLAAPLATLLAATRAVSRGREDARRLQVLLQAAVDSQTLSSREEVLDALVVDARRLLRIDEVDVRRRAPAPGEVGASVRGAEPAAWVVAPVRTRARSSPQADHEALAALAAVSAAAFDRLRLTEDLVRLARYDPLTGLPNRAVFLDQVNYALLMARRSRHLVALLMIDLDGFKPVNDRFGHAAGDAVLVDVAHRLRAGVREGDTVARLGGDEFAVLLEDIDGARLEATCERLLDLLSGGVRAGEHLVDVGASIGVAATAEGRGGADELLRNADLAMYEAKSRGRGRVVHYRSHMLDSRLERLEMVEALGSALTRGDIAVVYQPVVQVSSGRIKGVEALARWCLDGEQVSPGRFVPLAEQTGLINELGAAVLARVAEDAPAIAHAAGGDVNVAVNVSPSQLKEPAFVDTVLTTAGLMVGTSLVVEITEREGIGRDRTVLESMRRISELGVPLSIDDFGTGFSSISYLREVPASIVKIDASLAAGIDHDEDARVLLRSITMMARALGHDIVVEGVERSSQLALLRTDAPDTYVQGYLLHRPMPLDELLAVLRINRQLDHVGRA